MDRAHEAPGAPGHVPETVFRIAFEWELRRAERFGDPFALVFLHADPALGEPLRALLPRVMRRCDLAAFRGDGLCSLLMVRARADLLPEFARRLREGLGATASVDGGALTFAAVAYPEDGRTSDALESAALAGLQTARGSDNRLHFTPPRSRTPAPRGRVLVVDDDLQNRKLLRVYLSSHGFAVVEADNGARAIELARIEDVDLVLLDVMMPGLNGFETCRQLKDRQETAGIPVVLVTALDDVESKVTGIEAGADDFLTKPYHFEELSARATSLIRMKRSQDGMTSMSSVLVSLAAAVEAKDRYTQGHTERTARLAVRLGERLGLSSPEIDGLRIGGSLHDIGKIGVPESILNKPGPLTDEEWKVMRTHPEIGHRICASLGRTLEIALTVIRHHHERLDGSSYPDGLAGNQIPMVARIMAVVDVYDALVTDRPYRAALTREHAVATLRAEVAGGKLDAAVVETLIEEVGCA
jgi:putative two-component system response regulator